jgi:hypothetical protein
VPEEGDRWLPARASPAQLALEGARAKSQTHAMVGGRLVTPAASKPAHRRMLGAVVEHGVDAGELLRGVMLSPGRPSATLKRARPMCQEAADGLPGMIVAEEGRQPRASTTRLWKEADSLPQNPSIRRDSGNWQPFWHGNC